MFDTVRFFAMNESTVLLLTLYFYPYCIVRSFVRVVYIILILPLSVSMLCDFPQPPIPRCNSILYSGLYRPHTWSSLISYSCDACVFMIN